MTTISPILKNHLETNGNNERVYRHLIKHANDVKPNEPKAKLIRENFVQSAVSAIEDTYQDGKNFFKATKTGKLNDNNLGRINDLGMKAGALLIATYLASHAKTKTDAIMQFLGGTTFFASMALWPKLFINLPARLCHGFRIDHRYLSAQGDKKDLGLDNQFQPMDIFSDEEMLKMAEKAGIDPKDEFAKEKMQRKLQKTMLQNRTLWMATAGFATPLMTSLIGNAVTPKVREMVINHGQNKVENVMKNQETLLDYLDNARPIKTTVYDKVSKKYIPADAKLEELLKGLGKGTPDKKFYEELSDLFNLDFTLKAFRDPDDIKPVKQFRPDNLASALQKLHEENSFIDKESLVNAIKTVKVAQEGEQINLSEINLQDFTSGNAKENLGNAIEFGEENARDLLRSFEDGRVSVSDAKRLLKSKFGSQTESIIKDLNTDNSQFIKKITEYRANTLDKLGGRFKAYVDLFNPLVGSKSESVYTSEFHASMKDLFNKLGIKDKEYEKMFRYKADKLSPEQLAKRALAQQDFLESKIKQYVANEPDYLTALTGRTQQQFVDILGDAHPDIKLKEFKNVCEDYIKNQTEEKMEVVKEALAKLLGKDSYIFNEKEAMTHFFEDIVKNDEVTVGLNKYPLKDLTIRNIISEYIKTDKYQESIRSIHKGNDKLEALINSVINSDNVKQIGEFENSNPEITRALLGGGKEKIGLAKTLENFARFERNNLSAIKIKSIIAANFEKRLASGIYDELPKEQIQYMKNVIYNGSIGKVSDPAGINKALKNKLLSELFNVDLFKEEEKTVPNFKTVLDTLKNIGQNESNAKNDYLIGNSFTDLVKNKGMEIFENKTWLKIFAPMAIALVAVTLLVQPLFGKIDKEFPEKTKKGGLNNGNK